MKILNQLTIKHLKMNKKRTIVTIIGIILSTALMVGIGLLFSTLQDNAVKTVKKSEGNYHAYLYDLPYQKLEILNNNRNIDTYYYEKPVGFSEFKDSKVDYRKYFFVNSVSEKYFEEMKLVQGRFPKNDHEIVISANVESENNVSYKIGDQITLKLGLRMFDGQPSYLNDQYFEDVEERLEVKEERNYTIVGTIETPVYEKWQAAGYTFLTLYQPQKEDSVSVYIRFKKPSKAYEDMNRLVKNLALSKDEFGAYPVSYNDALLALYGASKYDNFISSLSNVLMIILTLISVGCIVVIYNSFAISVMERKKQFGLFSSIGATKKQLRHTVFFEALLVGMIGIPLGILGSFIGIGIVIAIVNHLLPNVFSANLALAVYPLFLIIPIVFMIATILISAYIPAYKASKITPIEAIRLNDDIKIKNKKLKTGKWIRKLFGIEGEIALKNIKRNKKKYRITIASLFISIVLFISFSTLVEYGLKTSEDVLQKPDYDIMIRLNQPSTHDYHDFINQVSNYEGVTKHVAIKSGKKFSTSYGKEIYKEQIQKDLFVQEEYVSLNLVAMDKKNYQDYLKELGLKEEQPILLNKVRYNTYINNDRKIYNSTVLNSPKKNYEFSLCEFDTSKNDVITDEEGNAIFTKDSFVCKQELKSIFVTEKIPFSIEQEFLTDSSALTIIIPETMFDQIFTPETENYNEDLTLYLKTSNYQKVDQFITDYQETLASPNLMTYFNYPKDMKFLNNLYLVIAILLYGFITLVTLIGVTSVFNTINTSIALRRKEFAMLRSMGLTPHGFNKILYFESFFFGAKSLLYGIPFSLLIILWIHVSMMNVSSLGDILIPWKSIGIAILGVFIIVFITMMYATKKMKKENILDAIREENI